MAIISLADACEAASRSLDKPSAAKIEAVVNGIFQKRFEDGQLNEANITLAELEKVRQSFINTLVFNYVSDRVYTIGTEGYEDIMENGVPTLDFVSSAKLNKYFTLSLKARNLLNSVHQLTREPSVEGEEIVLSKYRKGIDFSLGLTCTF